jgi:uncharacterized repeat protein (TIGR01451 family)
VRKVNKVYAGLVFIVIAALISITSAQTEWLTLEEVVINLGTTDEVGVGQILRVDVVVSSYGAPQPVNATIGVDIYNSSGYVTSFPNQTAEISQDSNVTFTFSASVALSTGYYTAQAFVVYDQNGTNKTLLKNASFKVVNLSAVSLGIDHEDVAAGETATFLQTINNNGIVPANATVKVWIEYDDPSTTYVDRIMATEPPATKTIQNNTVGVVNVLWAVPEDLTSCDYTNSSRYSVYSTWKYGTAPDFVYANSLANFNVSYVVVDTEILQGGYSHSGLDQTEAAPGGEVSGDIELLNRGYYSTVIHEVRAWVEDSAGNKVTDLSPTDFTLNIVNNGYKDVVLPGHNASCSEVSSNTTIAHQGALEFPFKGTLPPNLPLNDSYKVVFAIDYGVPRDKLMGNPWNIMQNYSFEIVKAEVTNVTARSEVAPGATQTITTSIKNVGVNTIDSASVIVEIRNPSNAEVKNFTDTIQNLAEGDTVNLSYNWDVPSNLELGTYIVSSRVHYATGVYHNLSTTFNVVRFSVLNISSSPVAPYESTNVTVKMENQGPTNATLELLGVKVKADKTVDLGTITNRVIPAGSTEPLNFTYYFDPEGMSNGTFSIEANITYGGISYPKSSNITLLPVGIKSFSLPDYGVTNISFDFNVTLHNIAGSAVSVFLNLTVNGSTYNSTILSVPANSTLTHTFPINLTSSGSYNITIYANYSSLPGRLSRSGVITIYDAGVELSIAPSDITYTPASPKQGDTITISAIVHNTGDIDASNVVVEFLLDSASYANKTISISANSNATINFTWSNAASGAHTVTIRADPLNAFGEKNESDNAASISVSVASSAQTPGGGGGGGPGVEPAFEEGLNEVTTKSLLQAVKEKRLENARFYHAEEPLLPVLAVLGYNPAPDSIREKLTRVEPVTGDVYAIAAELAVEKYTRLTYPNTVVVARGDIPADAIAAIAYAKSNRIPVLLTKPGDLPEATLLALEKFSPRRIIILGGEKAVSREVEEQLASIASVERIAGDTRYETAVKLAELTKGYDTIVVTNGEAPSSDAVFLAAMYRAPVVYVKGNEVPEVTADFLVNHRVTPKFRPVKLLLVGVNASLKEQIFGLILSPHLSGEVVVTVVNEDDDRLYVEVYVGSIPRGEFINSGSSYTYKPFKLKPGEYKVKLRWLDPDKLEFNYQETKVSVNPAERTEITLRVPRITQ